MEGTVKEMQMKRCLECRIGIYVLEKYADIFKIMDNEMQMRQKLKMVDDKYAFRESKERLEELSHTFGLEGTDEDKYREIQALRKKTAENDALIFDKIIDAPGRGAVEKLSKLFRLEGTDVQRYQILKKVTDADFDGEENMCLTSLHPIIRTAESMHGGTKALAKLDDKKEILKSMHEANNRSAEGYDAKKGRTALKNFKEKKAEDLEEGDREGIMYIFGTFLSSAEPVHKFERPGQCAGSVFFQIVEENAEGIKAESDAFYSRVDRLGRMPQKIMYAYMQNAPKYFGCSLNRVMLDQNMTETDVVNVIGSPDETGIRASTVQALGKTAFPQRHEEGRISLISRALLVSEDVLYKGAGKRYGNWMEWLDMDGWEMEKCEREKIKKFFGKKGKKELEKAIGKNLGRYVHMDDDSFRKFMEENPESFHEEEYYLYEDYECFAFLLNKPEAYALLEALENLEESEPADENAENAD